MHYLFFLVLFLSLAGTQIQINHKILDVEIADTPAKWEKGLMNRKNVPEGTGMLFVYPNARNLSFWMKNTLIPLSIAFFDDQKAVINILDMDPPTDQTLTNYRSLAPALYALEVPQGWFEKHGIKRGAKFTFLD